MLVSRYASWLIMGAVVLGIGVLMLVHTHWEVKAKRYTKRSEQTIKHSVKMIRQIMLLFSMVMPLQTLQCG